MCQIFRRLLRPLACRDAVIIILIFTVSLAFTLKTGVHRYGDGSNYYLMTASLAGDRDLALDARDINRWTTNRFEDVPAGTYLVIDRNGALHYGKPILYPLLAAPFFFVFGSWGFAVLNALFLGGAVAVSYLYLRRYLNPFISFACAALFYVCSFIPAYASWVAPEMMLFFLCAFCLWLGLAKNRILLPAFIIGAAASVKPHFVLLLLPIIRPLFGPDTKLKHALFPVAVSFLGSLTMLVITACFLKQINPYVGIRGYLPGYPDYPSVQFILDHLRFDQWRETVDFFRYSSIRLLLVTVMGFFVGRFTGLCWYLFPGAICVVMYVLLRKLLPREERLRGNAIILSVGLLASVLILSRPMTYFGGDFIGNRYFFMAPALIFLPTVKYFKSFFRICLFLPGFIVTSHFLSLDSQRINRTAHTRVFPQSALPLEISLIEHLIPPPKAVFNGKLSLYAPLGIEPSAEGGYFCDKGREIVVTTTENIDSITLEGSDPVSLRPFLKLKDSSRQEYRVFFYHKAGAPLVIKDITSQPPSPRF